MGDASMGAINARARSSSRFHWRSFDELAAGASRAVRACLLPEGRRTLTEGESEGDEARTLVAEEAGPYQAPTSGEHSEEEAAAAGARGGESSTSAAREERDAQGEAFEAAVAAVAEGETPRPNRRASDVRRISEADEAMALFLCA